MSRAPTLRFVFKIGFPTEKELESYVEFWKEISALIQQEEGARGTRLHRVVGERAVLAIAEWDSYEARARAYQRIAEKYPPGHKIYWQAERFGGSMIFQEFVKEVAVVWPPASSRRRI